MALSGAVNNIIVYLIQHFNVKSIDAAQISGIINGCTSVAPLFGAILSDSYFGSFRVVVFSSVVSLISMLMFTLTAAVPGLQPPPCAPGSTECQPASLGQLAVLYGAVALMSIGTGGTRFNSMAMGANQFDDQQDQNVFFNWYLVLLSISSILGATVIVYIEDNVSWATGFGVCAAASAVAVITLLLGFRYYRRTRIKGSPFTSMARVIVASLKKRKLEPANDSSAYYHAIGNGVQPVTPVLPTKSFSFLNRAALVTDGDANGDGSIAKPWRLCTVRQVEDLKTLIRIIPLWTSTIFITVCIATQMNFSILQALTMDRAVSRRFSIPAGSLVVIALAANAVALSLLDRAIYPALQRLAGINPTPLQRIGVGCLLNVASMVASALIEKRRGDIVRAHHATDDPRWTVPMPVLWLLLPFALTGLGEAFHFPGQIAFYYQEFPKSLKSTATGLIALIIAIGFYISTAVIHLVRRTTTWLPDNINNSRIDKVYWLLAVLAAINYGYFILCAKLYKLQCRVDKNLNQQKTGNN
ncbi:hypothetical protein J5N97_014739 [Dioscorea zingiberensis]|uniref:Uncharacterized protein n=1 Tax=Dioscorea zingiberensis TaxID=325984 RepID=A0A9D5CSY4_9LILI|nr:hypothetical protein J5N97_014739 [Dioscorea zingiberensis]